MAGQELLYLSHEYRSGYPAFHPVRDMNLNALDFVERFRRLDMLEIKLVSFACLDCPSLIEHVSICSKCISNRAVKISRGTVFFR